MHIATINDSDIAPYDPTENGQEATMVAKLTKLQALRGTLNKLDPATNSPPVLEANSIESAETQETQDFPQGWLHELWAPSCRDHASATAWALSALKPDDKPLLWVTNHALLREQGMPYGPGLIDIGINPADFILIRAHSHEDGLWALEEAIKSNAFGAIVGELSNIDLTSSRRLSLAAQTHQASCLLVMRTQAPPQSVAYSRWHVNTAPSISDTEWPGLARIKTSLHKHRGGELPRQTLREWHHAHHRFHMVPSLVDKPLGSRPAIMENTTPWPDNDASYRAAG